MTKQSSAVAAPPRATAASGRDGTRAAVAEGWQQAVSAPPKTPGQFVGVGRALAGRRLTSEASKEDLI